MSAARRRSPIRLLRSRRGAICLLAAFGIYIAAATLVPQGGANAAAVVTWVAAHPALASLAGALGLHHAYTTPVFIVLSAWLTAATCACAWERTRWALGQVASATTVSRSTLDRLRARPQIEWDAEDVQLELASARAEVALRELGLKVTRGPVLIVGRSRPYGLLGSPVFHWALAALFVTIAAGQLTRSEGLMGVVVGTAKIDEASSYGVLDVGPLRGSLTGYSIGVPEMKRDYRIGSVDYGPTPVVEVSKGGRVLAQQIVRANAPLKLGSLVIHRNGFGRAAILGIGNPDTRQEVLLDASEQSPSGVQPVDFTVTTGAGEYLLRVDVPATMAADAVPALALSWAPATGSLENPAGRATVARGESVTIGDLKVSVESLTMYARLSIVDDGSVGVIYVLFVLAIAGISAAVLAPTRSVLVVLERDGGTMRLKAEARHGRADPDWPARARAALKTVLVSEEESA